MRLGIQVTSSIGIANPEDYKKQLIEKFTGETIGFGKYKGKTVKSIIGHDVKYVMWLTRHGRSDAVMIASEILISFELFKDISEQNGPDGYILSSGVNEGKSFKYLIDNDVPYIFKEHCRIIEKTAYTMTYSELLFLANARCYFNATLSGTTAHVPIPE